MKKYIVTGEWTEEYVIEVMARNKAHARKLALKEWDYEPDFMWVEEEEKP